jgi:hypothetical protein
MAVTGVFVNFESGQNNQIQIICGGPIDLAQLKDPMILYSHGGLLNQHIIGQLTHFVPVQQTQTINLLFKFDQCTVEATSQ